MSQNETSSQFHESSIGNMFLQIVLIIELIVGLPGIILALWIFCVRMKQWKPHVIFLFNLVLADFLLLISVPFRLDAHIQNNHWRFGSIWCRINLYMLSVNRSASIAFMTVVAVDRYFKVVHPHHCLSRITTTQAGRLAGLIWAVVIAPRVPLLTIDLLQKSGNVSLCRSFNSYEVIPKAVVVHYVVYVAEFFLSWFLLLFCSASIACHLCKRRMNRLKMVRKAIRTVVVISLVFTFCFMPSVVTGVAGLHIKTFYPKEKAYYNTCTQLFMVCIGITYLNSALDPLIYFYSSSTFNVTLKRSLTLKKNARAAKRPKRKI
ncbi:hydroxycarboxylic acid receptor 2 [Odontesthes bonariensis]|uniref:hydroxycarboxylic acid receptor 2 n=1 Tax=Odontesthes bonariensis TaxID=219752 RepID=UPI003F582593